MATASGAFIRVARTLTQLNRLNPYLMNGSYTFAFVLFCLHAIVGLLLCLGYRTRVMIVLAWIMHAGLQARNISVSHGGDIYFRCILFWSLFLPLARVWSIDRYLKDQEGPPRRPKSTFFFGTASVACMSILSLSSSHTCPAQM